MELTPNQIGALRFAILEDSKRDPLAKHMLASILALIDAKMSDEGIIIEKMVRENPYLASDYEGVLTEQIIVKITQQGLSEIFQRNFGPCAQCGKLPNVQHHCDRWDCRKQSND